MMKKTLFDFKKFLYNKYSQIDKSDIDFLCMGVLNCSRLGSNNLMVSCFNQKKIERLLHKRLNNVPICQLLKQACFYGRDFYVNKNVLLPRPETEELVNYCLKNVKSGFGLDMCTGSGVIAITINKQNNNICMVGSDISKKALKVANKNKKILNANVKFINSNLFNNIHLKFDFIISNPPYIKSDDINGLPADVLNEPHIALDGGSSGLDFYKQIIKQAPHYLNKNGLIFFELGFGQSEDVKQLLQKDFEDIQIVKDINKIDRIIKAKLKN